MAEQSNTFCILPFIHSHASVNGNWRPCCNANYQDYSSDKNYFKDNGYTHKSWFQSDIMNQLRHDMLTGVKNPMCNVCWKAEEMSNNSLRKYYNKKEKFQNFDLSYDDLKIQYLDLKLSNECNLKCRMCDYTNSNKILEDMIAIEKNNLLLPENFKRSSSHEKLINEKGIKQMPDHIFKEIVNDILPDLKVLKITGGEPLVQKQVLKLLDICVKKGYAKNIELLITTNATKFTATLMDNIKDFKRANFNVSCDGYGTVYDYIRYPFNWNKFTERVNNILDSELMKSGRSWYTICPVAQMYNIENLPKLQKWTKSLKNSNFFSGTFLQPSNIYNSLEKVPVHILEFTLENIEHDNNTDVLVGYLKKIIEKKNNNELIVTDKENKQIVDSIKALDHVRSQSYKDYLEPLTVQWLDGLFKKYA